MIPNFNAKITYPVTISNCINNSFYQISNEENDLYNKAYNLFFSHKYYASIKQSDILLSKYPKSYIGYNIRGIAKAYSNNYDGAIKDIDTSLSLKSNYGYAVFNKALTYELYGKMNEALKWYKKDLEIEDYLWSYYGISSIYARRNDIQNTMKYLNKAIDMDNCVKEYAKTEHDFDPVRSSKQFQKAIYGR